MRRGQGQGLRAASRSWKRRRNGFSPPTSRMNAVLQTPWFYPHESGFKFWPCRNSKIIKRCHFKPRRLYSIIVVAIRNFPESTSTYKPLLKSSFEAIGKSKVTLPAWSNDHRRLSQCQGELTSFCFGQSLPSTRTFQRERLPSLFERESEPFLLMTFEKDASPLNQLNRDMEH